MAYLQQHFYLLNSNIKFKNTCNQEKGKHKNFGIQVREKIKDDEEKQEQFLKNKYNRCLTMPNIKIVF